MIRLAPFLALFLLACYAQARAEAPATVGYGYSAKPTAAQMRVGGNAFAPPAFYDFCKRHSGLCSTRGSAAAVALSEHKKAELNSVNRSVNAKIVERDDPHRGSKADQWDLPSKAGDCEDFAILKKSELIRRGWPKSALLLTVATAGGEGHTVLTVRTSEGDLILDNRTNSVKPWSKTSYRYFARQAPGGGKRWERIQPRP